MPQWNRRACKHGNIPPKNASEASDRNIASLFRIADQGVWGKQESKWRAA